MESELFIPLKLMIKVFKATGMWQDGNQSWRYFFFGYLIHIICIEIYIIGLIIFMWKCTNFEDFIDSFGLSTCFIAEMFKCLNFFYHLKHIKKSTEMLEELLEFSADKRWKTRENIKAEVDFGFKVYKIFWFTAWTTCISGALVPFTAHRIPYKVWFPFDTETNDVGMWVASFILISTSFYTSTIEVAVACLPIFLIAFAIGLFNELSERLKEIGESEKETKGNIKELIKYIEIQKKTNDFIKEFHKNFSTVTFLQGFMSSLTLCTSAFTLSTATEMSGFVRVFTFMIPMTLEIFLPCFFGNELSLASSKLSTALFHSNWYKNDKKLRNIAKIFMENTKKNSSITAFGVFTMNLSTFTSIINSAYSLFAILKKQNN